MVGSASQDPLGFPDSPANAFAKAFDELVQHGTPAARDGLSQIGDELMRATARVLGWDRSTVTQRLKGMGFRALVESGGDQQRAALALAGDPTLARAVELKLLDYYDHLVKTIQGYRSVEEAIADCKKRFKNLPDRHFRSVESLVRRHFDRSASTNPS